MRQEDQLHAFLGGMIQHQVHPVEVLCVRVAERVVKEYRKVSAMSTAYDLDHR